MPSDIERILVPWYSGKKNGLDRAYWRGILRDFGCKIGPDDENEGQDCYSDTMPRKPKGGTVVFEMLPELATAIRGLRVARGLGKVGCLVVPHFGHFGSDAVWEAVAVKIADMSGLVIEATSGVELDGQDIEAGKRLLKKSRPRAMNAGKKAARSHAGRPKITLGGTKLEEALKLFADENWSIPMLADKFGFKVQMTFLRRVKDVTGTWSKGVAVHLADQGKWPPKRKMTDGEVKQLLLAIEAGDDEA